MKKLLIVFVMMMGVLTNAQEKMIPGVTVTGEGTVEVTPDQVTIQVEIEHEGDYISEIKKQTEDAVDAVLDFLEKEGIPEKNIETQYVRLGQQYQYQTKTYTYSSRQAISIKLENIDRYDEIMSGLMKAGVNRINSVQFDVSNKEKYEARARVKAAQNAKEKAEGYAGALGQKIGRAIAITESGHISHPVYMEMAEANYKAMDASGGNRQTIASGEMEIKAMVTVTFNLQKP